MSTDATAAVAAGPAAPGGAGAAVDECCGGAVDGGGECADTDNGGADTYGDDCAAYMNYPSWCGGYDDDDFSAAEQCCSCGGGSTGDGRNISHKLFKIDDNVFGHSNRKTSSQNTSGRDDDLSEEGLLQESTYFYTVTGNRM